jgi:hypothetical protein
VSNLILTIGPNLNRVTNLAFGYYEIRGRQKGVL